MKGDKEEGGGEAERVGSSWQEEGGRPQQQEGEGAWRWGRIPGSEGSTWREEGDSLEDLEEWGIQKSVIAGFELSSMITFAAGPPSSL